MDILILQKGEDGTVMAQELGDLNELGELARLETELVQTLAEEDVDNLAAAMDPEASPVSSSTRTCGPRRSHPRCDGPAVS